MPRPDGPQFDPKEFSVVDQGRSPLNYDKFPGARNRFGLVHPDLELPPVRMRRFQNEHSALESEYWAPQVAVGQGLNNRPLKKPKTINNPSAAAQGTGAFVDFLDMTPGASPEEQESVYVDFVNKRPDLSGLGAADRLIRAVAESRPNATMNLGRVLNPRVWSVGESLRGEGRNVQMQRDF